VAGSATIKLERDKNKNENNNENSNENKIESEYENRNANKNPSWYFSPGTVRADLVFLFSSFMKTLPFFTLKIVLSKRTKLVNTQKNMLKYKCFC